MLHAQHEDGFLDRCGGRRTADVVPSGGRETPASGSSATPRKLAIEHDTYSTYDGNTPGVSIALMGIGCVSLSFPFMAAFDGWSLLPHAAGVVAALSIGVEAVFEFDSWRKQKAQARELASVYERISAAHALPASDVLALLRSLNERRPSQPFAPPVGPAVSSKVLCLQDVVGDLKPSETHRFDPQLGRAPITYDVGLTFSALRKLGPVSADQKAALETLALSIVSWRLHPSLWHLVGRALDAVPVTA